METAHPKTVNRAATMAPAAARKAQRPAVTVSRAPAAQGAMTVSAPHDPAEREASATAKKIVRMTSPEGAATPMGGGPIRQSPSLTRFADTGIFTQKKNQRAKIDRKAEGEPNAGPNVAAEIQNSVASGAPLPLSVRRFMEPRFGADFSQVRIHTGEGAARLNRQVSALAFTVGNQIFFGKERFRPESDEGRELIAHELTHTLQQGAAVQRSAPPPSPTQMSPLMIQRLGVSDALDYFADAANHLPGFSMLTYLLGANPINLRRVERTPVNLSRAAIGLVPGGNLIFQALQRHNLVQPVGSWLSQQLESLGLVADSFRQGIDRFLASVNFTDLFDLGGVWRRAERIFTGPIDRIIQFVGGLVSDILRFIREALLRPVARLAEGTRAYDLMRIVLGEDPVTGEPYPRTAENTIGGFMRLIGQEERWATLQQSNAVPRAWAWFREQTGVLSGFVREIPQRFHLLWESLEAGDLLDPIGAFGKVWSVFGGFVGSFISWAGGAALQVMIVVFETLAPGAMPYLRRAASAIPAIVQDPAGFARNLVCAGIEAFRQFAANILRHLGALGGWLTGLLAGTGISLPERWDLRGILSFVLQLLGVTWRTLRPKLVRILGERMVSLLERGVGLVVTLAREGPAGAWREILAPLQNLQETVGQIRDWAAQTVVGRAVLRVVSMLAVPAGGVIQAIAAIQNTFLFFRDGLRELAQAARVFFGSVVQIAGGAIGAAAGAVESAMARSLPVVLGFLARQIGLGGIGGAIRNIIERVRRPVERALDQLIEWIVTQARRLQSAATGTIGAMTGSAGSIGSAGTAAGRALSNAPATVPAAPSVSAPTAADAAGRLYVLGGLRMFRTRKGPVVELPSDITVEEVLRLEAEAEAAEKRLGKGPGPQPVPDVRKLATKEEKKEKFKPQTKAKPIGRGRGKAVPKPAAVAAALLKGVGPGKVAQYLAAKGTAALVRGIGMLGRLRQNEQTHDDAAEKRTQSEKAVVIPVSDEQSKSNTGQVKMVEGRPKPAVDEKVAKKKFDETLKDNIPKNLEEVDNFKRDQKAGHVGAAVMGVVQGDKNNVVSTFGDVRTTPPPTPSGHIPENLPEEPPAPPTPGLNLGQGTVAPLQKEHTDLSNFTKEADGKLKEEGVTQEQLDMVDSGELADANREKKGMEKSAKSEPLAVEKFARQAAGEVDTELKQEEKTERAKLRAKRRSDLGATGKKQKDTRTALEKKREEIASQINGIYNAAQESVKKKLAALEIDSMKRFDEGNAKATKAFEENVNREFAAYKADRYSGWFGWARKAKDWLLGMEDLPRVKEIFERNRTAFVTAVNTLVENITADNKKVIQECKDELAEAKKKIEEFVAKLEPGLQGIGKKSAEEMNDKLNELDRFVGKKEEELQGKLKDKQTAAIRAIDDKIAKMKEAMSGALAKLGRLLLWAAKKFFTWALGKFGVSLGTIESIIDKGVAVLKAIFTGPIQFVKRLISAAGTGFENFGKNFIKHLKDAVFEWLTGSLEGLVMPESWNLQGILSVVFQMLGITYRNIRDHLLALVPEPVVKSMETTFSLVKTLIKEGPMAAWEELKGIAGDLKEAFVDAVKDWIKWKVVQEAIKTVLAMFIPGAGIVRAIIGIYDTIVFFIQKAKQIIQMVGNFLGSIAEIAAGNLGAAAAALEEGLARGLKLVIDFLARFLRLSGITQKVREAIQKVRTKVNETIAKVARWIVDKAKKLWKGAVAGTKAAVGKIVQWWRTRKTFKAADGETHALFFKGEEKSAVLTLQSVEMPYSEFVNRAKTGTDAVKIKAKQEAARIAGLIDTERNTAPVGNTPEEIEKASGQKATKVNSLLDELKTHTSILFGPTIPNSFTGKVNGGLNGAGFGVSMSVKPLTNKSRPAGAPPTSANNGKYADINERRESAGGASYYVKGHLLNQELGGPGEWANLTPLSRSGNAQHERQAEAIVKRTVDLPAIVEMSVTPDYAARSDKSALLTRITNSKESADAKRVKSAIVEGEEWAPQSLSIQAYLLDESLNRKNTIMNQKIPNPVDRRYESYYLASSPKPIPVNLSTADAATIATLPGIGEKLAAKIIAVRDEREDRGIYRFSSYEQIADLVKGIGPGKLKALEEAGHVQLY